MIILNIYVCTILFALASLILMVIEVSFYAKRHNLVSTIHRSFGESLFQWFKLLLQCAIPLYNIFCGFVFMVATLNENFLAQAVQNAIEKGTIKYKEEKETEK